ncbi:hypothetical protein B5D80_14685 [Micromonospora wenchangensis]|uniref:Uncharacterized protein n=1 Tax=Micromonospora wenchangensis TaxID=1185415 RepID=A0A246RN57_9ACTN|nr:hypothetical protein [Micromonospora wenchangensis]OWV07400.1 hypothetical protein B5D80_14685 [Micromonospora wenchangensis]
MGLFGRKRRMPSAVRPPLAAGERVLAWAAPGKGGSSGAPPAEGTSAGGGESAGAGGGAAGDGVLVATNLGLWLPGRAERLGWHDILKAVWSGRELTVTPAATAAERDGYLVVADGPAETYLLLDPGDLPHQVRARVTRSVAYTQQHPVPGGSGRIAARRVAGSDGLTWTVRYDPGTPVDADEVRAETDQLVAAARAATAPADL